MPAIELSRRGTILADARARGGFGPLARAPREIVRVGLDSTAIGSAAAAAAASASKPQSAAETMEALASSIACLKRDVATDACSESYGPDCAGSDAEVDHVSACLLAIEAKGKALDVSDALTCAGVEVTDENIAAFASCVKKREDAFGRIPRGTLAYCAIAVRRGIASQPVHSSMAFRDALETWSREFEVFRQKWEDAALGEVGAYGAATGVSMSDLEPYVARYNRFYDQFTRSGGSTSCSRIQAPGGFPWLWVGLGAAVVVVSLIVWQVKTIASIARPS